MYIVRGIIQTCIYSQWAEVAVDEPIQAETREEAIAAVLMKYKRAAERQDPYATVVWEWVSATPPIRAARSGWCV